MYKIQVTNLATGECRAINVCDYVFGMLTNAQKGRIVEDLQRQIQAPADDRYKVNYERMRDELYAIGHNEDYLDSLTYGQIEELYRHDFIEA